MKRILLLVSLLTISVTTFAQVSGGSFTASTCTTGDLNWTNPGTVNNIVIFAKAGSAITVGTPTNNVSTYTANTVFGSGTAYQNDAAAFCVYKSSTTATTASITGLTPGVTYHFLAYDINGTTYSASHAFSGSTPSITNVTSLVSASDDSQITLTWVNPSCFDEILVVAKPSTTIAGTPTGDGTAYTAVANFAGAGTAFDVTGKVVYKGSGSSVVVTGLTNGSTYFLRTFTRKGTTWSAGTELSAVPLDDVSSGAFNTNMCLTTGTVSWTNPSTVGTVIVFAKAGSAINSTPPTLPISTYTANSDFSAGGTAYENDASAKCVYKGTGTNVNLTGLTAGVTYHFLIFNANGNSYSLPHIFNGTTLSTPPNATGLGTTSAATSINFSWINPGCFDEVLVVAKTSTIAGTPTGDGTAYTANNDFTLGGTTFDVTGKVVYKGSGTSVNVVGLNTSTTYFFRVFTRKGTTWSLGAEVSDVTICTPVDVTALKISDANTTANLYWTDPACFDEVMIVAKQGTASVPPTFTITPTGNGSAYTANASFTGGGTAFDGGKVVFKSGTNPGAGGFQTTNLTTGLIYTFKIFTRKGTAWSSGVIITTVPGPPVLIASSLTPADGSTGVSTEQTFTATFNEKIYVSHTTAVGTEDDVEFDPASGTSQFVARGSGAPSLTISGNTLSLEPTGGLTELNVVYNVLIGNKVLTDSTGNVSPAAGGVNDFTGTTSGTWNFTTASGVTVTAPAVGTCVNQFTTLGDIVITEASDNNFQGTDNGSFQLVLGFDKAGYIFNPGTTGVTATALGGGDIQSITVTSVTFTQATFTIQFANVANDGQAKNDHDAITISGLKVSRDGSVAPPALIVAVTATNLTMQGITENSTTLATINGGTVPASPTITYPAGDNSYCVNANFSALNITASDPDVAPETFNWYNDAALTSVIATSVSSRTVSQLIGASPAAGTYTRYATQVDGCESVAATITIIVTSLPTANAGANQTGANAVCPGTNITLGGAPTATGGLGSYTYSWTGAGGPGALPNPVVTMPDPGASNQTYPYQVIVTDGNNCSSAPAVKQIEVKTIAQAVNITSPNQFNFADNDDPVNLTANVSGGVFSGVGVIAVGTSPVSYKFDPELAGASGTPYPISYTVALANGCQKTISQDFTVSPSGSVIPQLPTNLNFCSNEPETAILTLSTYYQNILTSANYSLIRFESDQGGVFFTGPASNNYKFYPSSSPIGANRIYAVIKYNPDPPGSEFRWVSQSVTVNEVPFVNYTGLIAAQNVCANDEEMPLTGNFNGGSFGISVTGADGTFVSGNGLTVIAPGQVTFNPFDAWVAYGSPASTITRYIRYTYDPGTVGSSSQACSNSRTIQFTIVPPPPLAFTSADAANTEYCFDAPDETLAVSQTIGVVFSGYGVVDRGNGTAIFDPSAAFTQKEIADGTSYSTPQTISVTAVYTNVQGCQRTINRDYIVKPLPAATFTFSGSGDYCYEGATFLVDGGQPSGSYVIRYLTVTRPDTTISVPDFSFDPSFYFDKATSSDPTSLRKTHEYRLTYTATSLGCSNTQVQVFKVSPSYEVTIAGIENNEIYCGNQGARTITFTPSGGVFTLTQTTPSVIVENPGLINGNQYIFTKTEGTFDFSYVITSGTSCTNSATKTVRLLGSPKAEFAFSAKCNGDLITYLAQPNNPAYDSLYSWSFGDSVLTGQSVQFRFPLSDRLDYNPVKLKVEYEKNFGKVCTDSIFHTQVIGPYPNVDILFSNVCKNDNTEFEIDSDYPIEKVSWNFGDGNVLTENFTNQGIPGGTHGGSTSGSYGSPLHKYTVSGTKDFDVLLEARSPLLDGGCLTTLTKKVPILERVIASPSNPYSMSKFYQSDKGLWIDEDVSGTSTWQFTRGTALNKAVIMDTPDSVWITNATGPYNASEISFVNSPCFDLAAFTKPVLSLDYWVNTEAKDGAVIQYSADGGLTWHVLGNLVTGLDWFNAEDISSDPGQQTQYGDLSQLGWSGKLQDDWKTAKNSLDGIPLSNIRFRIGFSSDGNDQFDGFAFNNVKIEERNRIMLVEHFTNINETTGSKAQFNLINSPEVVKIQYHTSFPGPDPDPLNQRNAQDNNARSAYYGLTDQSVPLAVIDGHRNGILSFATNWFEDYLAKRSLSASPYQLSIGTLPSSNPKNLTVQVTIDSISKVSGPKPMLHIAVVEKTKGTNQYVLKKLLPNAAGNLLPNPIIDEFTVVETLQMPDGDYAKSEIAIIAFVQDEITKDVYQSAVLTNPDPNHIPEPSTITSTEDPEYVKNIHVYPNPASRIVNIELPASAAKPTPVVLIDAFGKTVYQSEFKIGEQTKSVTTDAMADGIYMLQLTTPGGSKAVRKVMIKH